MLFHLGVSDTCPEQFGIRAFHRYFAVMVNLMPCRESGMRVVEKLGCKLEWIDLQAQPEGEKKNVGPENILRSRNYNRHRLSTDVKILTKACIDGLYRSPEEFGFATLRVALIVSRLVSMSIVPRKNSVGIARKETGYRCLVPDVFSRLSLNFPGFNRSSSSYFIM
ncbi:hypothetical protein F4703DRAFT_1914224 [Phycomyces blakesleeanus]